ncbi:MAG: ABC transporter permease, partial [Lachnospiraceae bacterium]|nr:ABC transporter permease [Lachnospiraceae bacterium]
MRNVIKMTIRSIKTFFGRYMAILLIVGLSAGFFAGLKITKAAMVNTLDIYMDEQNFYDYRLISTLGFTDDDVQELAGLDGVSVVEGMYSQDYMISAESGDKAFRLIGLPDHINRPSVVKGRLPEESNECVVDDELFKESDIGSVIKIADENEEASLGMIK